MKYDCSKTLDYAHEFNRICEKHDCTESTNCPFYTVNSCGIVKGITQKHIDTLQKWSDEHPEKTRQSEFLKLFPNAEIKNGYIEICPQVVDITFACKNNMACNTCQEKYWLAPVED